MNWLNSLTDALDSASGQIVFFFRDDDAGWADARLFELLDLFAEYEAPLDLAVIPKPISYETATRLRTIVEKQPKRLSVHQHGYAHQNHEQVGRKSEFGATRPHDLQLADIRAGKDLLMDLFGPITEPIFTPPWNRCTATTAACLQESGFIYLSRDTTATPINSDGLLELPIAVDWLKRYKNVRLTPPEIGESLSRAARSRAPVGVMLHHALINEDERRRLGELLKLISSHARARCVLMRDVMQATAGGRAS